MTQKKEDMNGVNIAFNAFTSIESAVRLQVGEAGKSIYDFTDEEKRRFNELNKELIDELSKYVDQYKTLLKTGN